MLSYFNFVYFLFALLIFGMGILILFSDYKSFNNRIFAFFVFCAIGWMATLYAGYFFVDLANWDTALFWMRLAYGFSVLGISLMTVFIYNFPKETFTLPKLLKYFYVASTIALFYLSSFTPYINKYFLIADGAYVQDELGSLYALYAIDILFNLFASIGLLIIKLKQLQGIEKQKITLVTFGYFIFVSLAILTNVVLPIFNIIILQREIPIVIAAFIIPSYYSVQQLRFFNLSHVYSKLAKEGILLGLYILVAIFINNLLRLYTSDLISLISSSLIAIGIYTFLKRITPDLMGSGLKYIKSTLADFKSKIFYCETYPELIKIIEDIFLLKLNYVGAKIFIVRKGKSKEDEKINVYYENDFIKILKSLNNSILLRQEVDYLKISDNSKDILREALDKMNAHLCMPLFSEKQLFGFFTLTKKESEKVFLKENIDEIIDFKRSLEISLMNILLKANLQEENDLMKAIIAKKTKQLKQQFGAIKKLIKQQADFIAVTAHEFRTPLSIALFQLEDILETSIKPPSLKEELVTVNNSLHNLKNLTQKLFEVQQYDLDKVEINKQKSSIKDFINELYKNFTVIMKEKSISFKMMDGLKTKTIWNFDQAQINQVIHNLLTNAYKFTPEKGSIHMSISKNKEGVLIKIEDSGKGLSGPMKKEVFEKFKTANKGKGSGIGLGLYLCKKIVTLHKGKIWVEDSKLGGAAFVIQLSK